MRINIIAQYHPAAALHQPRLWSTMLTDWENLPERVDASYIVVDPNQIYPDTIALDTENDVHGTLGYWSIAFRNSEGQLCIAPFFGRRENIRFTSLVVMHHAKWDLRVLANNKMHPPENFVCTMIAAYCMGLGKQDVTADARYTDAGMVGGLGLKYLARRHLGMEMQTWQEVKDKPDQQPEYNAKDSVATYLLLEKWLPDLPQHFWDIDMPLLPVLMAIEDRGIAINPDKLNDFEATLARALKNIDLPFNPFSPKQLQDYIYGTLGIEPYKFTDTGQPSTEKEVLEMIDDPIIRKVLEFKGLHKEQGTYVQNYIERMTLDGRIHSEFKQCSTATSRLSSAKPNLQNVPVSEMRELFIAGEGKKLIRVDWKQIELIASAVLAPEPKLIEMYMRLMKGEDIDIHQETADSLNVKRDFAKHLNFMLQNSSTTKDCAWKLSYELHISLDEARRHVESYYRKYPGLWRYKERIIEQSNVTKKVTNYMGRTLRVDALYAEDWRIRKQGERQAICFPIQSLAAEIVKLTMIDLHKKHKAPMLLQVHDELLFEVDEKDAVEYAHWLEEYIPTLVEIEGVRFPVEVSIGNNWWECMQNERP